MPRRPKDAITPQWEEYVDGLVETAAEAKTEVARLRSELAEAEADIKTAEADSEHWRNRHAELVGIVRNIVNDPLMKRDQVQSRLLLALERHGG